MGHVTRKSTSQSVYRCGKECLQFHHYIFHLRGRLEFWACSNGLRHTWCTVLYLHDGKLLLGAGAFLSLFKQCEARMVCTICFRACRKILCWGRWNLELVQFLRTHGDHSVFSFVMENSCLRQVEFWGCAIILENLTEDCFVTHAWCPLCGFFRAGKCLLEAGGILRSCNYSWKSDWRLFCYARMVSAVCFPWKFLAWGRWNFEVVHFGHCFATHAWCPLCGFFRAGKCLLEAGGILSLCNYSWKSDWRLFCYTHGVRCVFSFVMEISCLRLVEFWGCANFLWKWDWTLFCYARMVSAVCFLSCWKMLAWGRWNFELVQLFLDSWIADCFVRHAWFVLSVSSRGKILARGSWDFELLEVFLDIGILRLFLDNWIADCLVWKVTNLVKACFTNRLFFLVLL